ncbi:hypothetical protein R6Q59_022250 [Mikania micrantha]
MGDFDGGNERSNESDSGTWDFVDEETQIFDSQFCDSPTSLFGNKCDDDTEKLHALQSTIPFDDKAMYEYELATQVMDIDFETQMANLDVETQVVNLDAEFEEMDAFDETQLFNEYDTEEVVVSDHEQTEVTEIVDDSEEFSEEDSCRRERTQNIHYWKADTKEFKPKIECGRIEQHTSGAELKKFTSIRVASMRASGLAALNKASKLSKKSPSCPSLSSEHDIEHGRILFGKSHSHDLEKVNESTDSLETRSKCRFGRSIARKLFSEDPLTEVKDASDNVDLGGAANLPILEAEMVGLSYIDSQEPGDASQANALDFVDNFLKVNIECDVDCDIRKSTGGKSKPVLSVKGAQTFANSVNLINGVDKRRIFDWDDNLEDEGGGEFFRKKKDLFFASGSRHLKGSSSRSGRKLGRSDSKSMLGKSEEDILKKRLETDVKDLTLCKNLINDLDKQSIDMTDGKDMKETTEAQFDNHMGAEAKQDLCVGLQESGHDSTKTSIGCNHKQKCYYKSHPSPLSNNGMRITRSQSKISGDRSNKVSQAKQHAKKSEKFDNMGSDAAKRTRKVSLKRREVDKVEAPVTPVDQMTVKKQCIQCVTPLTRQSLRYSDSEKDTTASTRFSPKDKRRCKELIPKRKETGTQPVSRLTRSKAATLTEQEKGLTRERIGKKNSVCTTPVSHRTPLKEPSPICMGDEYLKQSCRRTSLVQEASNLFPGSLVQSPNKGTRQRKDASLIRVVFSRHLDGDIIKHQKKILSRLGASESSSMSDATHFVADDFVRTRNMLEAIAFGKPVVTHLWLEGCGLACGHIDEKEFILRDAKKEKYIGFSLPASLAHARQIPLLKGRRVLITPNTKPGKEILSGLVKAVHGVAVERMGRSLWKIDKVPEGLLILSCEEDYASCLPFLEKGAAIYSSELLLNGIVTQRLEYERHRLFLDHVKRTRSTIWVKKDDKYKAVGKVK